MKDDGEVEGISEEDDSKDVVDYSKIFLEKDEELKGVLKKGWLRNITLENSFSRQFLLLSQKRVYFSGTNYTKKSGRKNV